MSDHLDRRMIMVCFGDAFPDIDECLLQSNPQYRIDLACITIIRRAHSVALVCTKAYLRRRTRYRRVVHEPREINVSRTVTYSPSERFQ